MIRWLLSLLHRRRDHRPRAERLLFLALPQRPRSFRGAVVFGQADFVTGKCTRCGRDWLLFCRWQDCSSG